MNALARTAAAPAPMQAQIDVVGDVAILRLDCPSPSLWDVSHRLLFIEHLCRLGADPRTRAVVLYGRRLFDEPPRGRCAVQTGGFEDVVTAVARCRAPVVAAIPGPATGAGLELALACAGRVAAPTSTFKLPGVLAGRLPLHGALERLPRLIGVEAAADMIVFGRALDARTAAQVGLVDALASRNLPAFAANFAASGLVVARREPARLGEPEVAAAQLYGARIRLRQQAPDQTAPLAALRALEAAVRLPARRVQAETLRIAQDLAATPQARALAYVESGAAQLLASTDLDGLAAQLEWPMLREAVHLLDEGASPSQVDRCLVRYGFAEGPFTRADRLGLAQVFTRGDGLASSQDWLSYSATLDLMADAGRHGGPGAPGWYRRAETGSVPGFDPDVDRLLQASATFQRVHRAAVSDEAVVERCLYAAINAAAGALDDHPQLDPCAVDAVWTGRLGFPRWRGGPLFEAAQIGPNTVAATLGRWRERRNTAGAPCLALLGLAG